MLAACWPKPARVSCHLLGFIPRLATRCCISSQIPRLVACRRSGRKSPACAGPPNLIARHAVLEGCIGTTTTKITACRTMGYHERSTGLQPPVYGFPSCSLAEGADDFFSTCSAPGALPVTAQCRETREYHPKERQIPQRHGCAREVVVF